MELPVLVSERCGNHFEAVVNGENGYLFNPLDAQSVRAAFEALMGRGRDWRTMGERSRALYSQLFDRQLVIENFSRALHDFTREPV